LDFAVARPGITLGACPQGNSAAARFAPVFASYRFIGAYNTTAVAADTLKLVPGLRALGISAFPW